MTAILEPLSFEIPKVNSFGMWILRFKIRKKNLQWIQETSRKWLLRSIKKCHSILDQILEIGSKCLASLSNRSLND